MKMRKKDGVDRTMEKMLRRMNRAPDAPGGVGSSSSTAAEAIAQITELQRRIARGDKEAADSFVRKLAASKGATGPKKSESGDAALTGNLKPADARLSLGLSKKHMLIGLGGILSALLATAAATSFLSTANHSVAGTIYVDRDFASNVEIIFHSLSHPDVRVQLKTGPDGRFAAETLPAGDYKIVILPSDDFRSIPKRYASPISTPLRLKLHQDSQDLTMNITTRK